jgi:hypothetical protein
LVSMATLVGHRPCYAMLSKSDHRERSGSSHTLYFFCSLKTQNVRASFKVLGRW